MRVLAASLAIAASTVASAEQAGITANSSKIGTFGALTGPATSTASCRWTGSTAGKATGWPDALATRWRQSAAGGPLRSTLRPGSPGCSAGIGS